MTAIASATDAATQMRRVATLRLERAKALIQQPHQYCCRYCSWTGNEVSTHEVKDVDESGRAVRMLAAICPRCHGPARRNTGEAGRV